MHLYRLASLAAVGTLALAGCSAGDDTVNGTIAVTATDTSCQIADTDLEAGGYTFAVKNAGEQVTEFYVYQGSKVISEVENIAPGTTRKLTVKLAAGSYEGACKPGMKGDGIRTRITVKAGG